MSAEDEEEFDDLDDETRLALLALVGSQSEAEEEEEADGQEEEFGVMRELLAESQDAEGQQHAEEEENPPPKKRPKMQVKLYLAFPPNTPFDYWYSQTIVTISTRYLTTKAVTKNDDIAVQSITYWSFLSILSYGPNGNDYEYFNLIQEKRQINGLALVIQYLKTFQNARPRGFMTTAEGKKKRVNPSQHAPEAVEYVLRELSSKAFIKQLYNNSKEEINTIAELTAPLDDDVGAPNSFKARARRTQEFINKFLTDLGTPSYSSFDMRALLESL